MRLVFLSTLVWSSLLAGGWAADIFVDNVGGDDHFDGKMPSSQARGSGPFRTIERALRAARKGDRIILAHTNQPYRESITLQSGRHSGSKTRPFTILGNGAVLDGAAPVPADAWEPFDEDVFRFKPSRTSHQQLFLDSVPAKRIVVSEEGRFPKLEPLQWCLFDRHVYFRVEKDKLPQSYNLTYTVHSVGITLYDVRHVLIADLVVQAFQLDGINAHDNAFDVSLAQLTCRGNGRSGISVGGASRIAIEACLVGNNGAAQVRTEGYSHTRIVNCDVIANTAPAVVRDGGEVKIESDEPAM